MGSESVRVTIFGKEYSLLADGADAKVIRQVAQYVDSKIQELRWQAALGSDSRSETKIAVLTALNIAGELFETKAKYEAEVKEKQECQEKIKSINMKISSAVKTG